MWPSEGIAAPVPNSSRLKGRSAAAWRVTLIDCARSQGNNTGAAPAAACSRLREGRFTRIVVSGKISGSVAIVFSFSVSQLCYLNARNIRSSIRRDDRVRQLYVHTGHGVPRSPSCPLRADTHHPTVSRPPRERSPHELPTANRDAGPGVGAGGLCHVPLPDGTCAPDGYGGVGPWPGVAECLGPGASVSPEWAPLYGA